MKKWIVGRISVTTIIFLLLLSLTNTFCKTIQKEEQTEFANNLLHHAEQVSTEIVTALTLAKEKKISTCSAEDLKGMRILTNTYPQVYDVGIVAGNNILCSADWGVFSQSPSLPSHFDTGPMGYELYSGSSHLFPADLKMDITKSGNIIAFTDPMAFFQFTHKPQNFSYEIKANNHHFLSYESAWQKSPIIASSNLDTVSCSDTYNYCVYTYNQRAGLLYYSSFAYSFTILLCFVASILMTYSWASHIEKRDAIEFRFRRSIRDKKLHMEFQPIISVKSGKMTGVESLIRWHDEVYGKVSPELFLQIGKKLGLYPEVSHQTAYMAVNGMASIMKANPEFSLAINVDEYEIHNEEYLEFLATLLEQHEIKPNQIKIEITERIELPLRELADFSIRAKKFGFQISLDDFGTGLANLVWLTEIDFDFIKIDRMFTQSLTNDLKKDFTLSIIDMINRMDKPVIYEGVETKEEYDIVANQQGDAYIQGWYFYKSLPKEAIEHLIAIDDHTIERINKTVEC